MIWDATPTPVVGSMPVDLVGPIAEAPFVPDDAYDPIALSLYGDRTRVDPETTGAPAVEAWVPTGPPAEISFGPRREYLDLEALTPTPPHLRATAPPARPAPPRGPRQRPDGCASCDRSLAGAAEWQRCTVCRDPMCSDCLVSALVEHERAWCRGCAEWDAIEESYRSQDGTSTDRRSAS